MKPILPILALGCVFLTAACGEEACPGMKTGVAGLEGKCIACVVDADCAGSRLVQGLSTRESLCQTDTDCPYPGACIDSQCIMPAICSLTGRCDMVIPCDGEPGDPCGDDGVCGQGWCQDACSADQDCEAGLGTCLPIGVCSYLRCDERGECPQGTAPVEGTLACAPPD